MSIKIYPLNDWVHPVKLFEVEAGAITRTPLETGTVTGFLATSGSPTATAADASLVATAAHVANGWWRVSIDGTLLTASLMDTHFASTNPWLILQQTGNIRTVYELEYLPYREGTVEE